LKQSSEIKEEIESSVKEDDSIIAHDKKPHKSRPELPKVSNPESLHSLLQQKNQILKEKRRNY